MNGQIREVIHLMFAMMAVSMGAGAMKPVMLQAEPETVEKLKGVIVKPPADPEKVKQQRMRIREKIETPRRYVVVPLTEYDHDMCRQYGFPAGAKVKFRDIKDETIITYCRL